MTVRVIQWATGAMGKACLRTMIDTPGIEVVGALVYSEAKAGRDLGDLAGRPPTGVLSSADPDEVLALTADVVVHAGRLGAYGSHDEDLERILRSGKNVLSINGYTLPWHGDGERVARLCAAAEAGGVTLMGVGLNPGFIGEQLATTVSGLCARVDHIEILEAADSSEVRSAAYLFDILGFGSDPAAFDRDGRCSVTIAALDGMYKEALASVAHSLGMTLDGIETDHVVHAASADLHLPAGTVPAGTVSHTNWRWHAVVDGERRITMSIHWYVEPSHLPQTDQPLWQVRVIGHPGVRLSLQLEKHPDDKSRMSAEQYALAGAVINALPGVVAAPPGLAARATSTPYRADLKV